MNMIQFPLIKFRASRSGQALRLRSGQAILLSVIMLNGILISASAVAGLLITYQIRQANDSVESMKAFFAADAGIEDALYCYYMLSSGTAASCAGSGSLINSKGDRVYYSKTITSQLDSNNEQIGFVLNSVGNSGRTQRILETRIKTNF